VAKLLEDLEIALKLLLQNGDPEARRIRRLFIEVEKAERRLMRAEVVDELIKKRNIGLQEKYNPKSSFLQGVEKGCLVSYGSTWITAEDAGRDLIHIFNATEADEVNLREKIVEALFTGLSAAERKQLFLVPNIAMGEHMDRFKTTGTVKENGQPGKMVYLNGGVRFMLHGGLTIGAGTLVAPGVTFATVGHQMHPDFRDLGENTIGEIELEEDTWMGLNVSVVNDSKQKLTIGKGTIVLPGSVVNTSLEPMILAGGTPARKIRDITRDDQEKMKAELGKLRKVVEKEQDDFYSREEVRNLFPVQTAAHNAARKVAHEAVVLDKS
jgi:acetyltransferase-like isoleucine patch superfamily enzyme